MAKKTTPNTQKNDEKEETEVILVVKGAGEQEEDVHLNLFLRGFWPAVKALDENATIAQIIDDTRDAASSPHNEKAGVHKHLTEIRAKFSDPNDKTRNYLNKRILIKESYWEYEVLPSTALGNLAKEWQMSSHVFVNMLQDILFTRHSKRIRKLREGTIQKTKYPTPGVLDYVGNFVSYLLLFLLLLLPLGVTAFVEENLFKEAVVRILPATLTSALGNFNGFYGLGFVLVLAAIWAVAPWSEISKMISLREKIPLKTLPGLPAWTLILLILLLLSNPVSYFYVLLALLALQIAQLFSRRILWNYRKYANSDVDRASYYSYRQRVGNDEVKWRIGKVQEGGFTRLAFSPLIYRYFIFLALPLAFVITVLASILKWTKILGAFGEALDKFVKFLLVGYMDDVVNYATDPAQAHRVRSVVMEDIKHFHDLNEGFEVQRIHIVAHSQGTPITFEALFHFLEPEYQKKIYTYVTLGSILSYYHQARGILDSVYYNRFQMPIRQDSFPKEFKWMNFWNFTDPITEFYGLDEYTWFKDEWKVLDALTGEETPKREFTGPVNIRTSSSLLKNHGEYWDNFEKFQRPLAKRILGKAKPEEWDPEERGKSDLHHAGVLILWPFLLLLVAGVAYGVYWISQNFLGNYFHAINEGTQGVYTALFPPKAGAEKSLFEKITDPVTLPMLKEGIKEIWRNILSLSLLILTAWAAFDWAGQVRRAFKFGR
ncbi:MAG: hypothetical protein HZB18_14675 [Chloroflexi bacterium]|nr:hypothetical protein [Chloroflexota bacterium]